MQSGTSGDLEQYLAQTLVEATEGGHPPTRPSAHPPPWHIKRGERGNGTYCIFQKMYTIVVAAPLQYGRKFFWRRPTTIAPWYAACMVWCMGWYVLRTCVSLPSIFGDDAPNYIRPNPPSYDVNQSNICVWCDKRSRRCLKAIGFFFANIFLIKFNWDW